MRPEWSDRRIAELCALSPKTVSASRRVTQPQVSREDPLNRRVGRDGRSQRMRSVAAEAVPPSRMASSSGLDGDVGVDSPSVARSSQHVRSVPASVEHCSTNDVGADDLHGFALADEACRSAQDGEAFCSWFDRYSVAGRDVDRFVAVVPLSRAYEIADEARRRARQWSDFADRLEERTRPTLAQNSQRLDGIHR